MFSAPLPLPVCLPSEALPPPVSLIPRVERLLVPRVLVGREPVERDVLDDVLPVAAPEGELSAISNSSSPERMFPVQSLIWSLRLLNWLLIWLRLDHRNTPAPTEAAATAAAAIGLSLTVSIQSLLYWLRPDGLLLRLRLLFLGMGFSSSFR
jgi:hypothetical protein